MSLTMPKRRLLRVASMPPGSVLSFLSILALLLSFGVYDVSLCWKDYGLIVELSYGNTVALEQSIDKAYLTTTSKLVELMKVKFGFWDHLNAFKKYILLGQGDFIAILMESIGYPPS